MVPIQNGDLNKFSVSATKPIFCTLIVPGVQSDFNNVRCHTACTETGDWCLCAKSVGCVIYLFFSVLPKIYNAEHTVDFSMN